MSNKKAARKSYPHVAVAVFCENVITEKDGVSTLVRIIDQLQAYGAEKTIPKVNFTSRAYIRFVSGEAKGEYKLSIRLHRPDGVSQMIVKPTSVTFSGGSQKVNIDSPVAIEVRDTGLHWCDILLDNKVMTKMPLEVTYQQDLSLMKKKPTKGWPK